MNINGFKEWYQGILDHYGTLSKFDDMRTVYIMRKGLNEEVITHLEILQSISDPANGQEYQDTFQAEWDECHLYIDILDEWIEARNNG